MVKPATQRTNIDPKAWDGYLARLPGAHILQTWEWGWVKSRYGWKPEYCIWRKSDDNILLQHTLPEKPQTIVGAALILQRTARLGSLKLPIHIMYVPKGPVLLDWEDVDLRNRILDDLFSIANEHGAILIKIDPDVRLGTGVPGAGAEINDPLGLKVRDELCDRGWLYSAEQVQFRNTVKVDLTLPEEDILARMKQKTRYNIRLAGRKGVVIRTGSLEDLELLYQMYAETALRDGFVVREAGYYIDVWRTFIKAGMAEPIIAEVDNNPVAAVFCFQYARKAWYLYGMSRPVHREKMPNHLLQWEAIRRAKSAGCTTYDMWGAPDEFIEQDPLWGVYKFKDGFGGEVTRYIGAWDMPVRSRLYRIYSQLLPRVLEVMRQRGKARMQQI